MRALGVDVGAVRVGVAVSDPDGVVATPLCSLQVEPGADEAQGFRGVAARLAGLARDQGCGTVVVGLPRSLAGRDTASTRAARQVAEALRAEGVRVALWDERLSSAEAERVLLEAGRRRRQRRVERDPVAATIVLQGWLDARRRGGV